MKKIPIRQINTQSFTLRKLEDLMAGKEMQHALHRHDFYFILAVQKGEGVHEIDFEKFTVNDHVVYFLRPGQVHQLQLKAGASGYIMEFSPEFYQPLHKTLNTNFCQLDKSGFKKMHHQLLIMHRELQEKQEAYHDAIKASLDIFFIEFLRRWRTIENKTQKVLPYMQDRLEGFLELVELHSAEHKQVAWYTSQMNLSAYQLNEITKATLGKTSSEIINDHIILEAKRYLLATANQVKEIADILGYEDISYFIRFFKKHTGYTPDAFRNKSV
ncbi:MAG: AraC family transcriptional regulator [Sediminibacterium sp.]|nr:AraC family transcriptional regulator [Sediminibacterium sp.]